VVYGAFQGRSIPAPEAARIVWHCLLALVRVAARFVGVKRLHPIPARDGVNQPPGYKEVPFSISHPKMFPGWHRLFHEPQYCSPRLLHEIWRPKEIYITENGCAANDTVAANGNLYDSDRLTYLRNGMMWQ
jgi:beta-glucosidase